MIPLQQRGTAKHCHPKGLAFDISDLCLLSAWAERHGFAMTISLDHGSVHEIYEEVISFRSCSQSTTPPRVLIWRDATDVVVQVPDGQARRYGSVTEALAALGLPHPPNPADNRVPQRPGLGWPRLWV